MEVKIGVTNVAREITIETELTALQVEEALTASLAQNTPFRIEDHRGRVVVVPAGALGYVDIGESGKGRVGFGA